MKTSETCLKFCEEFDFQTQIGPKSIPEPIGTNFRLVKFFRLFRKIGGVAAGAEGLKFLGPGAMGCAPGRPWAHGGRRKRPSVASKQWTFGWLEVTDLLLP